jgi:hypothetical protein
MARRPEAAIILLVLGGAFVLYYSAVVSSVELVCPAVAVRACVVYWGLVGLSWAVGIASVGLAAGLSWRPRSLRFLGALPSGLSLAFLAFVALLFARVSRGSGVLPSLVLVSLIVLWPYLLVLAGGVLAALWNPKGLDRPLGRVPEAWPPPPSGPRPPE